VQKLAIIDTHETQRGASQDAVYVRLLQYLQALGLPPEQASVLAEEALLHAEATQPAVPLAAALTALQDLLAQQPAPVAMPLPHRQAMLPEPLDRSIVQCLHDGFLAPLASAAHGLLLTLQRRTGLLGLAAVAVLAVSYRQIG
jgi:hypothetical protein